MDKIRIRGTYGGIEMSFCKANNIIIMDKIRIRGTYVGIEMSFSKANNIIY